MDTKGAREILFRGKRIDNGEWVKGYLYEHEPALVSISSENDAPKPSKWFIAKTGFADWNMPRPVEFVEVDPSTVGQYTGMKDKNDKKVFEGDIVRKTNEGRHLEIFVANIRTCFYTIEEVYYSPFEHFTESCEYEVIGNIHDNPELLEDFNEGV